LYILLTFVGVPEQERLFVFVPFEPVYTNLSWFGNFSWILGIVYCGFLLKLIHTENA